MRNKIKQRGREQKIRTQRVKRDSRKVREGEFSQRER